MKTGFEACRALLKATAHPWKCDWAAANRPSERNIRRVWLREIELFRVARLRKALEETLERVDGIANGVALYVSRPALKYFSPKAKRYCE